MENRRPGSANSPRPIPQVDKILRHPLLAPEEISIRREYVAVLVRRQLDEYRRLAAEGNDIPDLDAIVEAVLASVRQLKTGGMRRVLNGTGVILNTNMGRAPVAKAVVDRLNHVLPGYCSLELSLESGKRGERTAFLQELLQVLVACESAIAVNNNAAAVMLAVSALSEGKEVIVSRGELIEIGGSFRLPDVVTAAGGILKEVGTTNRTRIDDYRKAVSPKTGLILRCHRSNYEIKGFTEQPAVPELVALAKETGVPFAEDLGSGALIDVAQFGVDNEPTVQSMLTQGTDLLMFSGDKLLGGAQAGIVVGKTKYVEKLRRHPIYRALRADKIIIAMLEAVLIQYLSPNPEEAIPALKMASSPPEDIRKRAGKLVTWASRACPELVCGVTPTFSTFGGGTTPGTAMASFGVQIKAKGEVSAEQLAQILRDCETPVIPIIADETIIIDLRTIPVEDAPLLRESLEELNKRIEQPAPVATS